jgi:membrane protein YdbS with pleckstrin-like domain
MIRPERQERTHFIIRLFMTIASVFLIFLIYQFMAFGVAFGLFSVSNDPLYIAVHALDYSAIFIIVFSLWYSQKLTRYMVKYYPLKHEVQR